jgi:hypothetical protein
VKNNPDQIKKEIEAESTARNLGTKTAETLGAAAGSDWNDSTTFFMSSSAVAMMIFSLLPDSVPRLLP